MTTCRNKLMNEGKPYPRSSCQLCGSTFGHPVCKIGEKPNDPSQAKYYYPTEPEVPITEYKYAIIYSDTIYHDADQRSRDCPGHGYPAYSETIEKIRTFKDEEALKDWIEQNNSGYSRKKFKAIRYAELAVSTEVKVSLA